MHQQLNLFDYVLGTYATCAGGILDNNRLYQAVAEKSGLSEKDLETKIAVGISGQEHSPLKRKIRWHQQTLKHLGLIERVGGIRGLWQLTKEGKHRLHRAADNVKLLAFSTNLGIAVWGDCRQVFSSLDVPIHLVITSPPYPLSKPRAYGNPGQSEYVDFVCYALEPIIAKLAPGASVCLNVSNDIFEKGSPARSLYLERLTLALHERLGLALMDRLVWQNSSKPPGPIQWASLKRVQLNVSYEPILWFTNDPYRVRSDNRRVLEQHSDRHLNLIAAGGEKREASFADGAYKIRQGSFSNETQGKIPRNILSYGHNCPDNREYRQDCNRLGLPPHGAVMPATVANFLIRFLSTPDDLVVDPFGGKLTTAKEAEKLGRRWLTSEYVWEYIRGAVERFRLSEGFWMNPAIECL